MQLVDFTVDGAWHDADLSAIVPAGANSVHIHSRGRVTTATPTEIAYYQSGDRTWSVGTCTLRPQVQNQDIAATKILRLTPDRKIRYKVLVGNWAELTLKVLGWFT